MATSYRSAAKNNWHEWWKQETTLHEALASIGVTDRPTNHYAMRELLAADGAPIRLADSVQGWDFVRQALSAA